MSRIFRSSGFSRVLRAASSALLLATIFSCVDSTAPALRFPGSVSTIDMYVPDSLKAVFLLQQGVWVSANISATADLLAPTNAPRASDVAPGMKYSISHLPLKDSVEAIPGIIVPQTSITDDGILKDVPLGFTFNFYGQDYDKVNVYSNGFLQFGTPAIDKFGFMSGGFIPLASPPTNIIAFAWTDWSPQKVVGGIRFETRGDAPHRRFLLQFNNVPECCTASRTGFLMMQLWLDEGTNVITILTNNMTITNGSQRVTQGIENADGTLAAADTTVNPNTGFVSLRVKNFFSLTNDAVRFTPPRPPVVTPPANVSTNTAPAAPSITAGVPAGVGLCVASVDVGTATATDDNGIASIVGVRSDGLALDAPYPKGVTTITWTATDTDGMTDSKQQTVTVSDKENPFITAPGAITADNDPHLPSAVVATGSATAKDNCTDVTVSSTRSDGADLSAPFMVGVTKITWKAVDGSGNSASADQSITVLDKEAPIITVSENLTVNATNTNGAIVNYHVSALDNVGVVNISCTKDSGTNFPIGDTPVTCTAYDAAGNSKAGTFVVTVVNAQVQMQNLLQYLYGLGAPSGATNPLANQLLAAIAGNGHVSCVKMSDFISLAAKKTRDLPYGTAQYMTSEASRICDVLGCPPSNKPSMP